MLKTRLLSKNYSRLKMNKFSWEINVCRNLKVIIYNKTRNFAGHTMEVTVKRKYTIRKLKEHLLGLTEIPLDTQYLIFGSK